MRVTTIAGVMCLMALLRADAVSAADGSPRTLPAISVCGEPARLVELSLPGEAVGGDHDSDEGTLWCLSPDDPRCSPLESGPSGVSLGQAKLGAAAAAPCTSPAPQVLAAHSCGWQYSGAARDGVLGRLERPPR
jgi:hypothetical protein